MTCSSVARMYEGTQFERVRVCGFCKKLWRNTCNECHWVLLSQTCGSAGGLTVKTAARAVHNASKKAERSYHPERTKEKIVRMVRGVR